MKERSGIFRKINNRLTFWFLLVSIIPMIFTVLYLYIEQVREIKQENYKKLVVIRDLKVDRLKNWIAERKGDLTVTSLDFDLRDLESISNGEGSSSVNENIIIKVRNILQNYRNNFPDYEELFVLDPATGKVIVSTKQHREGIDKSDDEYYKTQLKTKELFLKDIYYSHAIEDYAMGFSIPIFCHKHEGKNLVGILVARVNLDYSLFDLLQKRTGLGKTGETLIVNKDMLALNRLRWHENAPLKLRIEAAPAMKAVNGETGIIETEDYRGKKVLAAYTHIPETGWGFVCKQDIQELKLPIRKLMGEIVLLLIIIAIIIVAASMFLGRAITKPIIELKDMAKMIEQGDYSVRNQIKGRDEIGTLANSVNVMAEAIESRIRVQSDITRITNALMDNPTQLDFVKKLLNELMGLSSSEMGAIYSLNEAENEYKHLMSIGANHKLKQSFAAEQLDGEFGTAYAAKRIYHFTDIPEDTKFLYLTIAGELKPREIITIPVLSGEKIVAMISLANIHKYNEGFLDALNMSWNGINRTYSNILHVEKTQVMAYNLKRSNKKLEAQTEELQSQSEELQQQAEELQQSSLELQEQNMELEKQKEQVMEATRLKSEFLSNMSHELRTPLNSVLALSEILLQRGKSKLDAEEQNFLRIIERNGRNLLHLINDILDFSKIEAGKLDITPAQLFLNSVLENIQDTLKPLADKKGIEIKLELPEESPKLVTDEIRLHQILQNIAGNAVKFTEEGYVKFSVKVIDNHVKIKIEDSGIGIPAEKLPYIFEEFRQLDGSTSRQYEGTGLGLAIAGKLIKLLHGEIKVSSEVGEGTEFIVTLPIEWEGIEEMGIELSRTDFTNYNYENFQPSQKGRLLLVEDNESAIIQIKTVLQQKGFQISVAQNGIEALEFVEHTIPDGVILDLMMPEMDGFEVLENIRSKDKTRHLPVLILTAKDLSKAELARLSANNIQQLVHKGDVDLSGLMYKINMMLKKSSKVEKVFKVSEASDGQESISDKLRILIIEDNPDNMTTMQALIPDKYRVIKALDGITGLRIAISQIPDLILLDINLPRMSGIELLSMLKKSEDTKHIPIIAVTGRASREDKEELLEAGCNDYLAKPVEAKLLIRKISKWLDK